MYFCKVAEPTSLHTVSGPRDVQSGHGAICGRAAEISRGKCSAAAAPLLGRGEDGSQDVLISEAPRSGPLSLASVLAKELTERAF